MLKADSLLIAAQQKLILYHEGRTFIVHEAANSYSGITWCHNFIYVMVRDEHYGLNTYGLVLDHQFNVMRKVLLRGVGAAHQCIYRDGEVFVANTYYNKIAAWDRWDKTRTVWFNGTKRIPDDRKTDNHVNSIWYDDEHFYVGEHLFGPSRIRIFNFNWKLVDTWHIANELHNVYIEDGKLYVCDSAHEAFLMRDLETGKDRKIGVVDKLDWVSKPAERFIRLAYTRGLARGKDKFYVGCSAVTPRGDREKGESAIAVFDNDMNYLDKIILENTGGIGEIRVVNGIDRAHNGLYCPWDGAIPNG